MILDERYATGMDIAEQTWRMLRELQPHGWDRSELLIIVHPVIADEWRHACAGCSDFAGIRFVFRQSATELVAVEGRRDPFIEMARRGVM